VGEIRNAHNILVGKPERKTPHGDLEVCRRIKLK
jgi:hypothetical protein